ncbi:MAG: hypothetical protein QM305_05925 [Bacteroidota bacterium]|nr:hypothetical protein [Bacteroidota bacterium]
MNNSKTGLEITEDGNNVHIVNLYAAQSEANRKEATYSRISNAIKELKQKNLPIYWDILYKHLDSGGDALAKEYGEKFAKETYRDWNDFEVRKEVGDIFEMLQDPYQRWWSFGKGFVKLHDDGSFEMDRSVINEYYRGKWTYTVSKQKWELLHELCNVVKKLGIPVYKLPEILYHHEGKVEFNEFEALSILTGKPASYKRS